MDGEFPDVRREDLAEMMIQNVVPPLSYGSVYLAGPITGLTFGDSTDWRGHAVLRFAEAGITAYSPLRCKEYLAERGVLDAMGYEDRPLSSPKGITTRDRFDVMTKDLILVNFIGAETVSIGTVMEIAWADLQRKPIVVAMEEGNVHTHAMLTQAAGFIVPTLDEAIDVATAILLP